MKLFNYDGPVMRVLNLLADLIILNLITLLCSIPIFTAGAALTAMHHVLLPMARGEEGYIVRPFFSSFKENFIQSTLLFLITGVIGIVIVLDTLIFRSMGGAIGMALLLLGGALILLWLMLTAYVYPMQARFDNPIKATMKNSLLAGIGAFPRTAGMIAVSLIPLILYLLMGLRVIPLIFLFGFSGPGYLSALIYSPFFKKMEEKIEGE